MKIQIICKGVALNRDCFLFKVASCHIASHLCFIESTLVLSTHVPLRRPSIVQRRTSFLRVCGRQGIPRRDPFQSMSRQPGWGQWKDWMKWISWTFLWRQEQWTRELKRVSLCSGLMSCTCSRVRWVDYRRDGQLVETSIQRASENTCRESIEWRGQWVFLALLDWRTPFSMFEPFCCFRGNFWMKEMPSEFPGFITVVESDGRVEGIVPGGVVSSWRLSVAVSLMIGILSLGATGGSMGGSSSMMESIMVCFSRAFFAFLAVESNLPGSAYDPSGSRGITIGAEEFLEVWDVEIVVTAVSWPDSDPRRRSFSASSTSVDSGSEGLDWDLPPFFFGFVGALEAFFGGILECSSDRSGRVGMSKGWMDGVKIFHIVKFAVIERREMSSWQFPKGVRWS